MYLPEQEYLPVLILPLFYVVNSLHRQFLSPNFVQSPSDLFHFLHFKVRELPCLLHRSFLGLPSLFLQSSLGRRYFLPRFLLFGSLLFLRVHDGVLFLRHHSELPFEIQVQLAHGLRFPFGHLKVEVAFILRDGARDLREVLLAVALPQRHFEFVNAVVRCLDLVVNLNDLVLVVQLRLDVRHFLEVLRRQLQLLLVHLRLVDLLVQRLYRLGQHVLLVRKVVHMQYFLLIMHGLLFQLINHFEGMLALSL